MTFFSRQFHMFIAVAEELHFGRAAERLNMTQPPLSQQIRALERRLGVALFVRSTRDVRLTAAGRLLLERARRMVVDGKRAEHAVRQAGHGEIGSLAFGFVNSAVYELLPKVISHYRNQLPGVDLDLREMPSEDLADALLGGRIDVALLRVSSSVENLELEFAAVQREPMLLALPRNHPLAALARVHIRKLEGLDFVHFSPETSPYFREVADRLLRRSQVRPKVVYESLLPTLLSLVEAGMGVALIPAGMARLLADRLIYKPLSGVSDDPGAATHCAWRKQDGNPLVLNFVSLVRSWSNEARRGKSARSAAARV